MNLLNCIKTSINEFTVRYTFVDIVFHIDKKN